jgi:hypothetical protein
MPCVHFLTCLLTTQQRPSNANKDCQTIYNGFPNTHKNILSLSFLLQRASVKRFVSLQFLNPRTVGRTPCTEDQPVARPLHTQDNTNTELTQTDIHALSGIRTHDPSVRAGEDSSRLRPRRHCDRLTQRLPDN